MRAVLALLLGLLPLPLMSSSAGGAIPAIPMDASQWQPFSDNASKVTRQKNDWDKTFLRLIFQATADAEGGAHWQVPVSGTARSADRLRLSVRSYDAHMVGRIHLSFYDGESWKILPAFGVTDKWRTIELRLEDAIDEGDSRPWKDVSLMRLSAYGLSEPKVSVDVKNFEWVAGYSPEDPGKVGPYSQYADAREGIWKRAEGSPLEDEVQLRLDMAGVFYRAAQAAEDPRGPKMQHLIGEARRNMAQAWAMVRRPARLKMRAAWVLDPEGVRGEGEKRVSAWPAATADMKAMGINTLFAGAAWAGVAYYPSTVLPVHAAEALEKQGLTAALRAAKEAKIKVHAIVTLWDLSDGQRAPLGTADRYAAEGRLQVDSKGQELAWLCPCDSRNQELELSVIREAASTGVDGVHLESHFLPGLEFSYSDSCRAAYEKHRGRKVETWPQDVLGSGPQGRAYRAFLRDTLTSFLAKAKREIRKAKGRPKLSASVLASPHAARQAAFQEWQEWLNKGYLDFVVTTATTPDAAGAETLLRVQQWGLNRSKRSKVIPAIEWSLDRGRHLDLESVIGQAQAAARRDAGGIVLMEWRDYLVDDLAPYLAAGLFGERRLPSRPERDWKGPKIDIPEGGLILDDFEDGDLINARGGAWRGGVDMHGLGSRMEALTNAAKAAGDARRSLLFEGHKGQARAPWPSALVETAMDKDGTAVDLSAAAALELEVKGSGRFEVVLVSDTSDNGELVLGDFKAGAWWRKRRFALPRGTGLGAVRTLRVRASGRSDKDFELLIDSVTLFRGDS